MAKKLTKKERELKIKEVIEYALQTGESYKNIAKKCGVSVATVAEYLNNRVYDYEQMNKIKEIYKKKNPHYQKDNLETLERIYSAYNLLMSGLTVAEISEKLNSTVMIIERDLKNRLANYSEKKALLASKVLKFNSISNIQNVDDKELKEECKLFVLNNNEKQLMIYASSYLSNGMNNIREMTIIDENEILTTFDEILPIIDFELGEKVKEKMELEKRETKRK